MAKKFLSIKDFCKETGISRALFYTMRKNGDAPAMFNGGNIARSYFKRSNGRVGKKQAFPFFGKGGKKRAGSGKKSLNKRKPICSRRRMTTFFLLSRATSFKIPLTPI
mgnify:CR=1 FL=1